MATYTKRGSNWNAVVRKKGVYKSGTFPTKAAAVTWATILEAEIDTGKRSKVSDLTFGDLLKEYRTKVSAHKRGRRWEEIRIDLLLKDKVSDVKLEDLSRATFADWRDRRLLQVSARSVLREWALLSHALNVAVNEWEWIKENPMRGLAKPVGAPPRDRLPTQDEIDRLCQALGFDGVSIPYTATARVGAAFLFAIETAMRAQEICNLTTADVSGKVAVVRQSKTQAGVRRVPLSPAALDILELVRRVPPPASGEPGDSSGLPLFQLRTDQLDALFRKGKARALVEGLHFHDSRAEAITRLAKKLPILDLARMVGHKDLRMLQVYYRESAEDIAERL